MRKSERRITIKRPLLGIAGSFVLGEVFALLDVAVDWRILAGILSLAGVVCLLKEMISRRVRSRTGGKGGAALLGLQSRGMGMLLLFLSVFLVGYGRAGQVERRLDREAEWAAGVENVYVEAAGRVEQAEVKGENLALVLRDVKIRVGRIEGEFGKVMVYVKWGSGADGRGEGKNGENRDGENESTVGIPGIGMTVRLRGKLEPMEAARNPGEFDFAGYYRSRGTSCRMYGESLEIENAGIVPLYEGIRRFRAWCGHGLAEVCSQEDLGVFQAVLLGDKSAMDPGIQQMYRRNGISHLLAVSGQHLSIVGGGIYLLLRKLGLGRGKRGLTAGMLVMCYGVLTGSSGSALRAVVMILCLWLAEYLGRSYDCLSAMGLAGLWLLWRSPYLITQSGFQLSFGAVCAIGGLGNWLIRAIGAGKNWQRTLIMSQAVQIVLTPIVVWHYYRQPLYGLFLNLLVVPLAAALVYSGILGILLGSLWRPAGVAAVGTGHYVLAFYEWLCRLFEQLPGYSLLVGRPGWAAVAAYGAGMAAALFVVGHMRWLRQKMSRPGTCLAGIFLAYGICFCFLLPRPVQELRITCLDVGQGDGIVMECEDGTVLMDGGSSSRTDLGEMCMKPFLESRAVGTVDYAVVSHGDSDHISGLIELLEQDMDLTVKCLVLPRMSRGREEYEQLVNLAKGRDCRVVYMEQGDVITLGRLRLECLYAGNPKKEWEEDKNRHSLVVRAVYGQFQMLFTGDMDETCENGLLGQPEAEKLAGIQVLKAAHHGSSTSSSEHFLDAVHPRIALLSYGVGNSYGHPSGEVVERLRERGVQLWETGKCGAVLLKTDGERLWCGGWLE